MEAGAAQIIRECRKTKRPIRVLNPVCFEESDLSMSIRQQRKEDAEERSMRAKYSYPIRQELEDALRERDYYKRLISENSSFDLVRKLENDLINKCAEAEKVKIDSDRDRLCSRIYSLEEQVVELKERHRICRNNLENALEQRQKYSENKVVDLTPMIKTAAYNQELIQKNIFLEERLNEIVTAYNRLVFLTREKLGANAPTQKEIDEGRLEIKKLEP